jgi:hypothetical protein
LFVVAKSGEDITDGNRHCSLRSLSTSYNSMIGVL